MKLSFTTLGCPEWDLKEAISAAVRMGFDAIDFRGLGGEMDLSTLPEFTSNKVMSRALLSSHDLPVSCFSSGARIFAANADDRSRFLNEIKFYAALCSDFNCRYIRVFGGDTGDVPRDEAVAQAADAYRAMADAAAGAGAEVLLETHDDWVDSRHVKAVLDRVNRPNTGVIWDVNHPCRSAGESPEKTWELLGDRIKGTHWKDSIAAPEAPRGHKLTDFGHGDLPLDEMLAVCRKGGYAGYYTLEWEKVWHPDLSPAETAFPAFIEWMRSRE